MIWLGVGADFVVGAVVASVVWLVVIIPMEVRRET